MRAPPFFIVGSTRSGTTLLRLILTSHSHLSIPPETWYLDKLGHYLDSDGPFAPADVDKIIDIIVNHRRWPDMKLSAEDFRREIRALKEPRLRDIVEWPYLRWIERDGRPRWGDKTPGYITIVPQLARIFPGAKFIELIRDGRDSANSLKALRFYGPWIHSNACEWLEAMDYSARWSTDPVSENILPVHYEDIVLNCEPTVRRICEFLGEEFEPEMLAWPKELDDFIPGQGLKRMHRKLARMPEASDVFRWKREMSWRDNLVCEAFMSKALKRHGYELRHTGLFWANLFPLIRWYCLYALPVLWLPVRAFRRLKRITIGNQQVAETLPHAAESRDPS